MRANLLRPGGELLAALILLTFLPAVAAASDSVLAEAARPGYATVEQALEGDPAAIESLLACAGNDPDCRMIAAAALHRQDLAVEAIELLLPPLAQADQQIAQIVTELAFELQEYDKAWAAGSLWMESNDLERPKDEVFDQGMRVPWLMGQVALALSQAERDQALKVALKIDSHHHAGVRGSDAAPRSPTLDAVSRTAPEYPRNMMQNGQGGWAVFVLSVTSDGTVGDVREIFSSHREFAGSGMKAIRQWRFEPDDGDRRWGLQTIEFNLGDGPSKIPEAESGIPDDQGWIGFDDTRGWIEFTVAVNGVPVRAMLDSGADGNAISRRLIERADIDLNRANQVRVQGLFGREVVPSSGEFELRFGRASVPMRNALVLPMFSPDLILGVGLFQTGVVQIDYPNKRIRFLNRDAVRFESNVRVRTIRGRSPQVSAELGGKRVWMLFDTGNAGATLFKSRLIQRLDLERYVVEGANADRFGAVSSGRTRLLQLPGFKLGPIPFESLLASNIEEGGQDGFDGRRAGYGSRIHSDNVPYDGVLGSEVLKNFIITADLREHKIYFAVP